MASDPLERSDKAAATGIGVFDSASVSGDAPFVTPFVVGGAASSLRWRTSAAKLSRALSRISNSFFWG